MKEKKIQPKADRPLVEKKQFPVSIIVPMRNSATTIKKTLDSVIKQNYPIREIIVIDNVSNDSSVEIVKKYIIKNKKIPIYIVVHKKNKGVGASYNEGVERSKSDYVVFMHSDSTLPTVNELKKLTQPFYDDKATVATYSYILNPEEVWETYNFWMKSLMARAVGKESAGLNDKFDCINKKIFDKVRGFDSVNFGHHIGVGAEDSDLHMKLLKEGKVVKSEARVVHLHYLKGDYRLSDYIINRKLLARSYGRIMRIRGREIGLLILLFFIKPFIAILPFIPSLFPYSFIILLLFSIWYMKKMYITKSTLLNPNIILLPFITIFLIYYETFWVLESFLITEKK